MSRCVRDIRELLLPDDDAANADADIIELWDEKHGRVAGGVNYDEGPPW